MLRNLSISLALASSILSPSATFAQAATPDEMAENCLLLKSSDKYNSDLCEWFRAGAKYARDLIDRTTPSADRPVAIPAHGGTTIFQLPKGQMMFPSSTESDGATSQGLSATADAIILPDGSVVDLRGMLSNQPLTQQVR